MPSRPSRVSPSRRWTALTGCAAAGRPRRPHRLRLGCRGLYLNLTRAMERFFPGERVSGALARMMGVLLVMLIIVGVLAAVFLAGVVPSWHRRWRSTASGSSPWPGPRPRWLSRPASSTASIASCLPTRPPVMRARRPAMLVGVAIAAMTLLFSVLSPWLVSGFQAFGVIASVFVALVWLRVVFLAMVYGAAMARYRDYVARGWCSWRGDAGRLRQHTPSSRRRAADASSGRRELERRQGPRPKHENRDGPGVRSDAAG